MASTPLSHPQPLSALLFFPTLIPLSPVGSCHCVTHQLKSLLRSRKRTKTMFLSYPSCRCAHLATDPGHNYSQSGKSAVKISNTFQWSCFCFMLHFDYGAPTKSTRNTFLLLHIQVFFTISPFSVEREKPSLKGNADVYNV